MITQSLQGEPGIGVFKPVSFIIPGLNELIVTAKDCSYTEKYTGDIRVDLHLHPTSGELVGFKLIHLSHLLEMGKTDSVILLLARAHEADWNNRKSWVNMTEEKFAEIYTQAFGLLLQHPSALKIQPDK